MACLAYINADDFGWDENRTKAIIAAARAGLITTTTAMVNMPWFDKAISLARGTSLWPHIGLHLCLTEGCPLTETIKKSKLFCDAEGNFTGVFHRSLKSRLYLPAFERAAVLEEAEAQMRRYLSTGLPMLHLDSHHHAHTDYSIASLVLPLAARLGFKTVRMSRNFGLGLTSVKRVYKCFVNAYIRRYLPFHVDYFCSYNDLSARWFRIPEGARVEMMVHPLYRSVDDGTLDLHGTFMDHRTPMSELVAFLSERKSDIKVVSPSL